MNCKLASDYMMKHFDKEINDIESAQLKQHLKLCKSCSDEFKELNEVFSYLEEAGKIEPPESFEAEVMKKISALEDARKNGWAKGLTFVYNIMATLSTVLLIVLLTGLVSMEFSFESMPVLLTAAYSALAKGFSIAAGVLGVLLEANFALIKNYYYIFATLLAMLLAVQKMFFVAVEYGRGGER